MRQFSHCRLLWVTEKRTDFWVLKILLNSNTTVFSTSNCEWKCFQPESTIDMCLTWRVLWFGKDLMEDYKLKTQKWIIIRNFRKFTSSWRVLTTHVMENRQTSDDRSFRTQLNLSLPISSSCYSSKVYSFLQYLAQLLLFGIFTHFRRVNAFPSVSLSCCAYNTEYI